ncbi:YceI domain-containing protein (plasmid) [Gordonia polyisoprenivorans VH2]|uniref:YceI domain-containing protein n=1 Tax=Gordonia polyisoprenivorans (strain DSM 44266 / VH2) TaxID=1112204 RepID=H6N5A6_GORPV|nr:YceI family protein [Gordonia polyisoprenivorans]AFA76151.1 YceI domain-containing protein [Gordonia polyisoprenivorans VH2]
MVSTTWELSAADGTVMVRTDVTGPAARTGHRLTIEMTEWSAQVRWAGSEPESLTARIVVDSLQVRSGEGGLTPMSGPERSVARSNALKSLKADKFREIEYESSSIIKSDNGYRVEGAVCILGRSRPHPLELTVTDASGRWHITTETPLVQTEFGIKPYALMMGALKVADEVTVTVEVDHPA